MRAEGDSAMNGDGENEEGAEKEIVGGHAESVVARGDALAKYGVEDEAEAHGGWPGEMRQKNGMELSKKGPWKK